jgi:uncharacterized protein DUF6152
MKISGTVLFIAVGMSMASGQAIAHHSFATHYDRDNVVEISGTLSAVRMRSPHSFFEVDVVNTKGETETWEIEAHAVPILRRLGITRDTFKVGDQVTMRGPRSRRPEKLLLFGAQISAEGGEQFEMLDSIRRPPEQRISDTRTGIEGIDRLTGLWMTFITGQRVADSPMPLNEAGIAARRAFDPLNNPASNCIPPNLPSLLMIPYAYEITRYKDTVTIFHEYARISRQVKLGATEANVTDPEFGRRTGRYEDGTLIIESTGFPALAAGLASGWEPNGNGADIPSSTQKSLIERYTVNADGSELAVDYTVSDPAYLTESYSARVIWHRMPDNSPIYEFDCDSEIASRSTHNAVPRES